MHPDRQLLQAHLEGELSDPAETDVSSHLSTCLECRSAIQAIEAEGESFAAQMRQAVREADSPLSPFCVAALAAAERFAPPPLADAARAELPAAPLAVLTAGALPAAIRDYEILAKLGEGGMGAVYKARHRRLKKLVALKLVSERGGTQQAALARFEREMEAVGRLSHPNIVQAHDAGFDGGQHYLVMEYVEGLDLAQLVRRVGPLPFAEACELIRQAAVGLQAAHENGMVHRDIKPSNLMLTRQGVVKILDLGLALLPDQGGRELTSTGDVMGTVDYMAPEQGGDSHKVDIRADLYSLGASLYKLLTGEAPFAGEHYTTPMRKLMALALEPAPPIRNRRPDLPPALVALIERLLSKTPAERFATPAQLAAAIAPFTAGTDTSALIARSLGERADSTPWSFPPSLNTDPVVKNSLVDTTKNLPTPAGNPLSPAGDGPWWRNPWAITAGGGAAFLAALLGIWLILRDQDGNERGRIALRPGDRIEVEQEKKPRANRDNGRTPATVSPADHPTSIEILTSPDWVWTPAANLGAVVNSASEDSGATLSANGLVLVFASDRPGGEGRLDLWMSTRKSLNDAFGAPYNLGPRINSSALDSGPCLSSDGCTLIFASSRAHDSGYIDLWMSTRASAQDNFAEPVKLNMGINSVSEENGPELSRNGLTLLFHSYRTGGVGESDIWMATRRTPADDFTEPVNLGPQINTPEQEYEASLSSDGLSLVFDSWRDGRDLWLSYRRRLSEPFGKAIRLGSEVNTEHSESSAVVFDNGREIYFHSYRPGGHGKGDLWMVRRVLKPPTDSANSVIDRATAAAGKLPTLPEVELAPKEWHRVLPYVHLGTDVIRGEWKASDQGLDASGREAALMLPVQVPGGESYEARVRFTMRKRPQKISVIGPVGLASAVQVDLHQQSTRKSGLANAAPGESGNVAMVEAPLLAADVPHELHLRVANHPTGVTISCSVNEKELVNWTGKYSLLGPLDPTGEIPNARCFCFGTESSEDVNLVVHSFEIRSARVPMRTLARLPKDGSGAGSGDTAKAAASVDFGLEFNGESYVDIPTFRYDGSHPLTFEARLSDWLPQGDATSAYGAAIFRTYNTTGGAPSAMSISLNGWEVDLLRRTNEIHAYLKSSNTPPTTTIFKTSGRPRSEELIDLAVVFEKGRARIYVNGKRANITDFEYPEQFPNSTSQLGRIGAWITDSPEVSGGYKGRIQHVRISRTARYAADYQPRATLESDADTYLLYRMNEGQGDVLRDASGNKHDGKIVGAKWVKAAPAKP